MKTIPLLFALLFFLSGIAQESLNLTVNSKWICYPGDFEIWTHRELMSKRTERNTPYPSMWHLDSPYSIIEFSKSITLATSEKASIWVDGDYFIMLNGQIMHNINPLDFELPSGTCNLMIRVQNFKTVPAMMFKSKSLVSDVSWGVTSYNADHSQAEATNFSTPMLPPSSFKLNTTPIKSDAIGIQTKSKLIDYGKETYAYPVIHGAKGSGKIHVTYGESAEEAKAGIQAETYDIVDVKSLTGKSDTLAAKAFRYIQIDLDPDVQIDSITALYEYLPLQRRGSFTCSDTLINRIYDMSYYTLELNTRQCHVDGIKRDHWVWSGDAFQSYLMNFYTFFDEDVNKRTLWGLRGHDPVNKHINTILDYSFYWIIGVYNHYMFTGDKEFIAQIYPRMQSTMNFCTNRLNQNNMVEGKLDDWVFVDWAPIEKTGELSFEQLLYMQSLKAMQQCADLVNDRTYSTQMQTQHAKLSVDFEKTFWSDSKHAYLHSRKNGVVSDVVTRYTNIFSIIFNTINDDRKNKIKSSALLNDSIQTITTPYMKFYELAALCEIGEQAKVLDFVKEYWGGMLKLGATTVWETFDPKLPPDKHYEMYGRPFGKSLCHAWGANPVYLFGRYYLGVQPTSAAYTTYSVEPNLGGLKWIQGEVPTPKGNIAVYMNANKISVKSPDNAGGILKFSSKYKPKVTNGELINTGNNIYILKLNKANFTFEVTY